ncbi:hypothetical protein BKI52_06665 [marine bacterium AO1-C]|nr:hypothetical protein BKI52_06665 [marine bacterium AO1-C]
MKAKIDKEFEAAQNSDLVWDFFSDPNKVVTCVPGAAITEQIDDTNYKGTVKIKIGPVTTSYKGQVTLVKLDKDSLDMEIHGKGTDVKGKGNASMVLLGKLSKKEDGGTQVSTSMEVTITGKLAQFGSRMIVDVTNQIFGQFIKSMQGKLAKEEEALKAAAAPAAETPVATEESTETNTISPGTGPATATTTTAAPSTPTPAAKPTPVQQEEEEVKPISALPLFFKFVFGSIARFFRRLFGMKSKEE